jgi:hypothetical protein
MSTPPGLSPRWANTLIEFSPNSLLRVLAEAPAPVHGDLGPGFPVPQAWRQKANGPAVTSTESLEGSQSGIFEPSAALAVVLAREGDGPLRHWSLSARGAVLLGRLSSAEGPGWLFFADDLTENMRFADEASADTKHQIDAYIARA